MKKKTWSQVVPVILSGHLSVRLAQPAPNAGRQNGTHRTCRNKSLMVDQQDSDARESSDASIPNVRT